MIKAKIEYTKKEINDEFYTPEIAGEMILPFKPEHMTRIWECTAIKVEKSVPLIINPPDQNDPL